MEGPLWPVHTRRVSECQMRYIFALISKDNYEYYEATRNSTGVNGF